MAGVRYVKIKGAASNQPQGYYTSISNAKQAHQDWLQGDRAAAAAEAAAAPAAPAAPPPPSTAPILSGTTPAPTTTPAPSTTPPAPPSPDTSVPSWWINAAITNPSTDDQKFANVANALLPTLAPEDQRTLASFLAQNYKDVYGGYNNTTFDQAPTQITDTVRKQFLSPQRAQVALNLLDKMKQASGVQDMGAGYDFLKNAVNLINQFTTDGVMTRERYQQFANAVSNLNKNATGALAPYSNLSQLFNLPQFTAGPLLSNTPNNNLFA